VWSNGSGRVHFRAQFAAAGRIPVLLSARRAKSWWDMLIEANAHDPMRLARAAALVIVTLAGAILLVAFGLHWIGLRH
jgi:hypothetical protein